MHIPDCSQGSVEVAYGGSANIWKSMHNGRHVAIKAFRVHNELDVILRVSALLALSNSSR